MKRLLFIYNIHAGKGHVRPQLADIQTQLSQGWHVSIHPTRGAGDATRITKEMAPSFDRIVCCGGDGTLHEVVAGLSMLSPSLRPPVGYIPAGTTNDFSKNLNLPRGMVDVARVAATGVPRPVDVGQFNNQIFVYVAAFGAFTDVAYNTPQQFKNMFGHLAYVLEGATRLGSIQSYHIAVTHDEGTLEGDFLYGMVSNTVSVGGFKAISSAPPRLDDGIFEVVLVRKPTTAPQLQSLLRTLLQSTPDEGDAVLSFRTKSLCITCQTPLPWTLDGEFGGNQTVAEISNHQQAVTIVYGN